jgi:hypothetical protein
MSKIIRELKFASYLIFHPFKGFNDLKYENKGSLFGSFVVVILTIIAFILEVRYTAFIFNTLNVDNFNIFTVIASVLLPFGLWCAANWSVTTLMDGEGKLKEIIMATGYSLFPMAVIKIIMVVVSRFASLKDIGLMSAVSGIATLWTVALIIFGTMIIHQYSFSRTIFTSILILVGMAIIVFIFMLFFSLIQQMVNYILVVYKELRLRV